VDQAVVLTILLTDL